MKTSRRLCSMAFCWEFSKREASPRELMQPTPFLFENAARVLLFGINSHGFIPLAAWDLPRTCHFNDQTFHNDRIFAISWSIASISFLFPVSFLSFLLAWEWLTSSKVADLMAGTGDCDGPSEYFRDRSYNLSIQHQVNLKIRPRAFKSIMMMIKKVGAYVMRGKIRNRNRGRRMEKI